MAETSAQQPPGQARRHPATVADVMRPPLTTVDQNDHVAAAAYLMRHAGATALVVLDGQETNRPLGIVTEKTGIPEAAETMTTGHFRHLPVVGASGLTGIVDIRDVCRALLDMSAG